MQSSTSNLIFRSRAILLISIAFFISVSALAGQQYSNTQAGQAAVPPARLPTAQPATSAAVSASGAASNTQAKSPEGAKEDTDESMTVKMGPGDLIEVSVYNVPELATKARVNNSGDLYLPLIDYVHVEGLTIEEAQNLIQKRLEDGGFVRSPHVTIFVDEAASQGVTILGEVGRSGIYPDTQDHKLYEVISLAGGFTAVASRKITIIRRNQAQPIHVDLPRNLGDDLSGNVEILPGDTITVPRAPIIYVVGDVGRPSGLLIDNGTLTVLQAIALAGGTNHTAKTSDVRLIRKTPTGMTEQHVQFKKMLEAKAPDLTLQADDILFVPVSGGRVLASRSFEAAMALTTAVTLYAVHP